MNGTTLDTAAGGSPWAGFCYSVRAWRVWVRLAWMDIRNRYRRSAVGWLWMVIHFLLQIAALSLVFCAVLNMMPKDFIPYLVVGVATYGFLSASLVDGGMALLCAEGYIKQLTFPKQVYLLRMLAGLTFPFSVNLLVFFAALPFVNPAALTWGMLWAVPGLLLLFACAFLHIWIMAFLAAFVRDVVQMASALMAIIYFLTPVFYTEELLRTRGLGALCDWNPFCWILRVVRHPLVQGGPPDPANYLRVAAYLGALVLVTVLVTRRLDRKLVYAL